MAGRDPAAWAGLLAAAKTAATAFPGALYAGVDVGLTAGSKRPVVFEVNAFGDLIPGVVDVRGRDTFRAEIDAYLRSHTGSPLPPDGPFENIPP